jgi:hypothetical protein
MEGLREYAPDQHTDPLRDTPSFGTAWVAEDEALFGEVADEYGTADFETYQDPQPIRVSRSAIADRQLCEQRRFWGYHAGGTGYAPAVEPTSLAIGNQVHTWMARVFALAYVAGDEPTVVGSIPAHLQEEAQAAEEALGSLSEEGLLAFALAYGWTRHRLAAVLEEYHVVAAEEEWAFAPAGDLEIPQRMDVILRRRADELLVSMDFKTVTSPSPDWAQKFFYDLQTLLYTEALEKVCGETGGIQYEGMVKGKKSVLKTGVFAGEMAYGSILVSPYADPKLEFADGVGLTPVYRQGLTRHKLKTVAQVVAWVEYLAAAYPDKLADQFPVFPVFLPSTALRAEVLGPVLDAERAFAGKVAAGQTRYEQSTGACLKFGSDHPCPFISLCWEGGGADPLGTGLFVPRQDHHADVDYHEEEA